MASTKCGFDDNPPGSGPGALIAMGPTIGVQIGFDPKYDPNAVPLHLPILPLLGALIDTGASESCIDGGLAMRLNLPIIDRQRISGAHGAGEVNVHLAHVHIPTLGFTIYGKFCAVDLIAGGQPHHALIGRTFLQKFTMIYEGRTGTVILHND